MAETTPTPTPELKTYHGNCHCGAVKFSVRAPESLTVGQCNCSMCFRKGYKHLFLAPGDLNFIRGEDLLKNYEFAGRNLIHRFCTTCGTAVMVKRHDAPPERDLAINARTLNDVDIWALPIKTFDGKALEPCYKPTPFTGAEPSADIENSKTYMGGCHCGNITMALKTKGPLPEGHEYVQECNCSICMRTGTILSYPKATQVSVDFKEKPTVYIFGRKFQEHTFCGICGVSVWLKRIPGSVDTAKDPDWEKVLPVNLRCFEDVEWDDIEIKKSDYKSVGLEYVIPS